MNFYPLNTLLYAASGLLENQAQNYLTPLQKRVAAAVVALFSSMALCYLAYRFCFKASLSADPAHKPNIQSDSSKLADELLMSVGQEKDLYLKVMSATGYFKDPEAYIKRWKEWRESMKVYANGWQGTIEKYRRRVETSAYAKNGEEKQFVAYFNVIIDTGFLMNPKDYLAQWKDHRGNTEELRWPEDLIFTALSHELSLAFQQ